jgi:NAD(P)-dependent dehydrogenase (short-subunit alcohol dehydrogenase family)
MNGDALSETSKREMLGGGAMEFCGLAGSVDVCSAAAVYSGGAGRPGRAPEPRRRCAPMGFSADTLRDRVAIVTGASQGIGRAIALELARVGADVVVCSRRPAALKPVADDVRAAGRRALAVECDVTDARQVDDVVARTLDAFGRIDVLVNNAGYRIRAPLEELPRAEWDAMIATNLTGVFLFSQAAGRIMIRQKSGKIVNVTSVAGMIAHAAREVPLGRLGRPEEIAWAVVFVASDQANFMTGETLYVSGGPRVGNREDPPGVTTAP